MVTRVLIGLKHYLPKFLLDRYPKHEDIINRLGHYLVTDQDFSTFMALIVDVYEIGYTKAIEDYKEQLEKSGIRVE